MSAPPDLPSLSPEAAHLVEAAQRAPSGPAGAGYAALAERVAASERRPRWVWTVPVAAAIALLLGWFVWRPPAAGVLQPAPVATPAPVKPAFIEVSLGEGGTLKLDPGSTYELSEGKQLELTRGRVVASIRHGAFPEHFRVKTPHLTVVSIGTRFAVEVDGALTRVAVEEGRVRVESASGGAAFVSAGGHLDSADPRLMDEAPEPPEPRWRPARASGACGGLKDGHARRRCYEKAAQGSGIAAQNALYALGWLAVDPHQPASEAVARWAEYEQRFPDGVFAPEVSAAILEQQLRVHEWPQALARAQQFEARFPHDSRVAEVRLVAASLECRELGESDSALRSYDEVAHDARAASAVRGEALFGKALCLRSLGEHGAAAQALREYLRAQPRGTHAARAQRLLTP